MMRTQLQDIAQSLGSFSYNDIENLLSSGDDVKIIKVKAYVRDLTDLLDDGLVSGEEEVDFLVEELNSLLQS